MPRLGELLVGRGLVSPANLTRALDACQRHGGRLGTWLIRLGLVSEAKVLKVLAEQTGYPAASALDLAAAPPEIRSLLPAPFARRNMVVAFAQEGRTLSVAMANPNDLILADEAASVTGLTIAPHVATEAALAAALALPAATAPAPPTAPRTIPPRRQWQEFWHLYSSPRELMSAIAGHGLPRPRVAAATFPGLAPLTHGSLPVLGPPTPDEFVEQLGTARTRNHAADAVLRYLSPLARRVALFSVHHGKVTGWAARGEGVVLEDFQALSFPLDRPSVFSRLSSGTDRHVGPLEDSPIHEHLVEALRPPPPAAAVVIPVRVRRKTAAFLWLDQGEDDLGELPLGALQEAADKLGVALEVLVLRQKIRQRKPLT